MDPLDLVILVWLFTLTTWLIGHEARLSGLVDNLRQVISLTGRGR